MTYSMQDIEFGEVVLVTHRKPLGLPKGITYKHTEKITNIDKFNYLMAYELGSYVNTDYIILVHYDGFIVHPEMWRNEFLEYDYIGSPWPLPTAEHSTYYDEDGNTCFTDLGKSAKLDGKTEMSDGYSGTFEDGNFKINNTTWALDTTNLDSKVGEKYNYKRWSSFNSAAGSEIEQDWRDHNNCELFDDYFKNVNLHIAPGTMYSAGVRSDELQLVWTQVTTCIKEGSWKAIYASSDEEFDKIVADMVAQANEYGYDQCVEFQENEVTLRAAAEDAARAGEVVE